MRVARVGQGWRAGTAALVAAVLVAGCGGGDDGPSIGDALEAADDDAAAVDGGGAPDGGEITSLDEPQLTTDPGTAYAEVDGGRIEYSSADSLHHRCEVGADRIDVNFQTAEGQDLLVQMSRDAETWRGSFVFQEAGSDEAYSVDTSTAAGTFGVTDGAMSYEGDAGRTDRADPMQVEDVDASVAVNCGAAGDGDDPTAVIDGETYAFPTSGAQSVTCDISATDVEITINRLALDDLQLSIDLRDGPDDWIGSVFVVTGDGDFTAPLQGSTADLASAGLTIDDATVGYEGPFETDDGGQVDGTVTATCP
jgi:hypothetical protein